MKLTEKQKRLNMSIWAAEELGKRYFFPLASSIKTYEYDGLIHYYNDQLPLTKEQQRDLVLECFMIIAKDRAPYGSKKAARILLSWLIGKERANDLVSDVAIIDERSDSLVNRWRKSVIKRDGKCVECGNVENLHAHHISHWADDPINRINVNNGITLCKECHAKQHPEISALILS